MPTRTRLPTVKLAALLLGMVFFGLMAVRLDLFRSESSTPLPVTEPDTTRDKDTWMAIYQKDRKIGYAHSQFRKSGERYLMSENMLLRINTMGVEQDIALTTTAELHADLTLDTFHFTISSGRFAMTATGRMESDRLTVSTDTGGYRKETVLPMANKPILAAGLMTALSGRILTPGETYDFRLFDPAVMGSQTVTVRVVGLEEIRHAGAMKTATRLSIEYQGSTQTAWLDDQGEVLREEGLLGLRLDRTTQTEALAGIPIEASEDLTRIASVPANRRIDAPETLSRLSVIVTGKALDPAQIDGGRQSFDGRKLTVTKEMLPPPPAIPSIIKDPALKTYLAPTPFVQSDHPAVIDLVRRIVSPDAPPVEKVKAIMAWMDTHIEKRPVLSLPDAVSTLANRKGDCNEHAVLFAALARAAGIPARVEAGLVYMNGRFYYHAWNRLYLGGWITADALFAQFPADVSHLRFAIGVENLQTGILGLIDNIELKIVDLQ